MKQTIYIATIGTGTAGNDSFVAHGILYGIRNAGADHVYLVPSASDASLDVADYIASEVAVEPYADDAPFFTLTDFDDLTRCRTEMRFLLRQLASRHPGATLIVNPTSGTKQMTTATYVAAIDEGVEHIEYITGERVDGVVKSGTERIAAMSGRRVQAAVTARNALALIRAGAYPGAEQLLAPWDDEDIFPISIGAARVFGMWDRFAYTEALRAANGDVFREVRKALAALRDASPVSIERAADMLAFVQRHLGFGSAEEALAVLYRVVELLAKLRMAELEVDVDHFEAENIIDRLEPPHRVADQLRAMQRHNDELQIGLRLALDCLRTSQSPFARAVLADKQLWRGLQRRQDTRYGHGTAFVPVEDVRVLASRLIGAAVAQWPCLPELINQFRFPDLQSTIEEEIDHA